MIDEAAEPLSAPGDPLTAMTAGRTAIHAADRSASLDDLDATQPGATVWPPEALVGRASILGRPPTPGTRLAAGCQQT